MPKPVAVFDIDGTIFRSSLLIELTEQLVKDGVFPQSVYEEFDKEYQEWKNRTGGYEKYIDAVITAFNKHLVGKSVKDVKKSAQEVVDNTMLHTYRFTRKLLDDLKDKYFLVAISGSPADTVEIFTNKYGFGAYTGTVYDVQNGRFREVKSRGADNKEQKLQDILKKHKLNLKNSVGVGDTESDAAFLELVEKPVAFNPNQKLLSIAQKKNWDIFLERKDVIYQLNCSEKDDCRLSKTE